MGLRIVGYDKRYLNSCADLVRKTWNLHGGFKNLKRKELVYIYYFLTCENYSEHLELLVNENDEVKGVLFGSIEDESYLQMIKYRIKSLKLAHWVRFHLNKGNLGDKIRAERMLASMSEMDAAGEEYADEFDSEINLFIVSKELRGKGYGRKLMDNYVEFCKSHALDTAFLWTDLDCSFSFYEKYGFKLYKKFYHDQLSSRQREGDNGMIYYLDIDRRIE